MLLRLAIAILCLVPVCANAADAQLKLPSFSGLDRKATEAVDITIGAFPLRLLGKVLDDDDPESATLKSVVKGLRSIAIRSYTFDSDNAYSTADIQSVRSQLNAPVWSQLAKVRDKKDNTDVDVFVAYDRNKVIGLAIVASGSREFTIVNVVGEVDLEQVAMLERHLHVPEHVARRTTTPML